MMELLTAPEVWMAFFALVTMEIVLGIDNLLFISIASAKLPEAQQGTARRSALAWRWSFGWCYSPASRGLLV